MNGVADQTMAAQAFTAGANYTITNNGPFDPETAISFATGNSMEYWIIAQALADLGATNLISLVPDPWAKNDLQETIQTSGAGSTDNINQTNVASAKALLTGLDNLLTRENVIAMAQGYASESMSKVPSSVLTALGNQAPVTVAQPTVAPVTVATVTAPIQQSDFTTVLVTKPVAVANAPVPAFVPKNIFVPNPKAVPTTVVSATASSNWMLWGAAAAAAYFLLKK